MDELDLPLKLLRVRLHYFNAIFDSRDFKALYPYF